VASLAEFGFDNISSRIEVFGQAQIIDYIRRYPSLKLALLGGSDDGFLTVEAWSQNAHMRNEFLPSEEQTNLLEKLREHLRGDANHLRILGEPGIGKTRLVLEAVRAEDLASNTVYVPHGEDFSKSGLFKEILRSGSDYPLVIVLDELPPRELAEIWANLKHRCGALKLISIDHGPYRSRDSEIEIFTAPRLPDPTIRAILAGHVGESHELDRWVQVCEGSPRVAQAVGENLAANPDDILRAPATVPLWDRFLHGYARHDSTEAQRTARVMRHLALFARFGFEAPVGNEAAYIAKLIERADPTVTWPIFQEIGQAMRDRRILQGSHTLFIVPWLLHIYLWREFWHWHGRGFDFVAIINEMPETLHGWFMEMFRYAHDSAAIRIIQDILRPDSIFSDRAFLGSAKGASLLDALAEADPDAALKLLESTLGTWSPEELLPISGIHQNFVWILEKLAVWRPTVFGALKLLTKLALVEKSNSSNNAAGTLAGLFRIGPEWAATEASPAERFPVLLDMLRSTDNDLKRLGLKIAESALRTYGGSRRIGPEHQGIKQRADLWKPTTYGELYSEHRRYWNCLINETHKWPNASRTEANSSILKAAEHQLRITAFTDDVLTAIELIATDLATDRRELNRFIIRRLGRFRDKEDQYSYRRLRRLNGKLARRSLGSRFQRYVLDTTWDEWGDFTPDDQNKPKPRKLLRALAGRVARNAEAFESLATMIATSVTDTGALFAFGEELCAADRDYHCLEPLLAKWHAPNHSQGLNGYFSCLKQRDPQLWKETVNRLLSRQETAAHGAELLLSSSFDDNDFDNILQEFEQGRINANSLSRIIYNKSWQSVAPTKIQRLLELLCDHTDPIAANVMVTLLDRMIDENTFSISPDLLFRIVIAPTNFLDRPDNMHSYHWRKICDKLIAQDPQKAMSLLDVLLTQMGSNLRLSYDHYVEPMITELCRINPDEAWDIVARHLLSTAPKWRGDVMEWLKAD